MTSLVEEFSSYNLSVLNGRQSSYKSRQFWSKGAVLTLVWSSSVSMLLSYVVGERYNNFLKDFDYVQVIILAGVALSCPIGGWLADVFFGRYKFIRSLLYILWVCNAFTILCSIILCSIMEKPSDFPTKLLNGAMTISFVVIVLTLGGFQANIVQFGIDQLVDASSKEIASYISLYIWTVFLSNTIFIVANCFCQDYQLLIDFLALLFLTIALCSDLMFNKWLIVEPASFNPLKVIFSVLKYAVKNKYPHQRSAFTYWEDQPYSRIDLAKTKYGGPFTTEQVEDVKTFFRMLALICGLSQLIGLMFVLSTVSDHLMNHYQDSYYEKECSFTGHFVKNCFLRTLVDKVGSGLVIASVPLFEFAFNSYLKRFFLWGIAKKLIVGMLLLLIYNLNLLVFEIASYAYTEHVASQNQAVVSIPCLLSANRSTLLAGNTLYVSYMWLLLPNTLYGIALYVTVKSAIEFICAQSPYSMKGLLIGVLYATTGLALALASMLKLSVVQIFKKYGPEHLTYGCGVWYLLATSLLNVLILAAICGLIKWYSRRRRDENVHNEQIFAVNYYDYYTRFNRRRNTTPPR